MNRLESSLAELLGAERLAKIQTVKVGIAGVGGLGSNCACHLVRTGFRRLTIVDMDTVAASNLNRQFYFLDQVGRPKVEALRDNLLRINPCLELTAFQERIDPANIGRFFADCQVVVEALDQPEAKQWLVEHFWNAVPLLVSASGLAGWENADAIRTEWIRPQFCLVGDRASAVGPGRPPLAPRVGIAAAKQANAVLEWVLQEG